MLDKKSCEGTLGDMLTFLSKLIQSVRARNRENRSAKPASESFSLEALEPRILLSGDDVLELDFDREVDEFDRGEEIVELSEEEQRVNSADQKDSASDESSVFEFATTGAVATEEQATEKNTSETEYELQNEALVLVENTEIEIEYSVQDLPVYRTENFFADSEDTSANQIRDGPARGKSTNPYSVNRVTNSGLENGDVSDWTVTTGSLQAYNSSTLAHSGNYSLCGGTEAEVLAYLDIDVSDVATAIDAGLLSVEYGAWAIGWPTDADSGQLYIQMLDGSGSVLAENKDIPQQDPFDFVELSASENLQPGTRTVRLFYYGERNYGVTSFHVDDIYVRVQPKNLIEDSGFESGNYNSSSNLFTDPSFESGDTSGWLITTGSDLEPIVGYQHSGIHSLFAGQSARSQGFMSFDVSSYANAIDAGNIQADYGAYINTWNGDSDHGRVYLEFRDSSGAVISSNTDIPYQYADTSTATSATAIVPVGTWKIYFWFDAVRDNGTDNDVYFDDAHLRLTTTAPDWTQVSADSWVLNFDSYNSSQNLIPNAGFENGNNNAWVGVYGGGHYVLNDWAYGHFGPHSIMGNQAENMSYYAIDVTKVEEIRGASSVKVDYGGYISTWDGDSDHGRVFLEFYDSSNNFLGSDTDIPFQYGDFKAYVADSAYLPAGTATIRYIFHSVRDNGSDNDAYLDEPFVKLTPDMARGNTITAASGTSVEYYRTIDVSSYASRIDANQLGVEFGSWVATLPGTSDDVEIQLDFLNSSGSVISTTTTSPQADKGQGLGYELSAYSDLPSLTRSIKFTVKLRNNDGSAYGVGIDDLHLFLKNRNLLPNSSFESALSGWVNDTGTLTQVAGGLSGSNSVNGGAAGISTIAHYDIDVSTDAGVIDAGKLWVEYGGWLRRAQGDYGSVYVEFYDSSNTKLGEDKDIVGTSLTEKYVFTEQSGIGLIPVNTRTLRFVYEGVGVDGVRNSVLFAMDNAYVRYVYDKGNTSAWLPSQSITVAEDTTTYNGTFSDLWFTQGLNITPSISISSAIANSLAVNVANADVGSGTFSFTPVADANGTATLTVTLKDGATTYGSASYNLSITAVNDAPTVTAGSSPSLAEDAGAQTLTNWATFSKGPSDESGQTLSFSVSTTNDALFSSLPSFTSDGTLSFTPATDKIGTATVTVVVTDSGGGDDSVTFSFDISVTSVNDPPTVTPGANLTIVEDAGAQTLANWATFTPGPSDESAQTLSFSVTTTNDALFASMPSFTSDGTLSYTPADDANGSATVSVVVTDSGTGDNSTSFNFNITVTAVNDAPVVTLGSNPSVAEDSGAQSFANWATLSPGPSNESSQTLSASIATNNDTLFSILPYVNITDGTLSFTPAINANGTATVTLTITDSGTGDNQTVKTFDITVTAVNDAPTATPGSNQTVAEDAGAQTVANWASYSVGPADESTQTLSFSISTNNDALFSVLPTLTSDGTLAYTPAADANGTATVTATVTDSGGGDDSTSFSFNITVTPVNDAPTVTPGSNPTVAEDAGPQTIANWATFTTGPANESDQTLGFAVTTDNDALFSALPSFVADGSLSFTPAANANGSATINVVVTDSGTGDNQTSFSFTVSVTAVNDAPTVTPGADIVLPEDAGDKTYTNWLTLSAGPADESAQSFSFAVTTTNDALFTVLPAFDQSGTLTLTTASNISGTAQVSVTVTDSGTGDNQTSFTFNVSVDGTNDPPVLTLGTAPTVNEDSGPQSFTNWLGMTPGPADESSQTLIVSTTNTNHSLFSVLPVIDTNGTLTFTTTPNASGTSIVTVTVTDSGMGDNQTVESFNITVNPVNDIPTVATPASSAFDYVAGTGFQTLSTYGFDFDDIDSTSFSALRLSLTSGYVSGEIILSYSGALGSSFDAGTGILTLSGAGTIADYEAAVASVQFAYNPVNPVSGTRTLSLTVTDDASGVSAPVEVTINITSQEGLIYNWTGTAGDNNWWTGSNWDRGFAPVANSEVHITGVSATPIALASNVTTTYQSVVSSRDLAFSSGSITLSDGGSLATLTLSGTASLQVTGGSLSVAGTTVNDTAAVVVSGGIWKEGGTFALGATASLQLTTGEFQLNNGVLSSASTLTVNNLLSGTGTVSASVLLNGTINPGVSTGDKSGNLTIANDLTLGATGTVQLDLESTTVSDVLQVNGNLDATVGTFSSTPLSSYTAPNANPVSFNLLTVSGSFTGAFATNNLVAGMTSNIAGGVLSVELSVNEAPISQYVRDGLSQIQSWLPNVGGMFNLPNIDFGSQGHSSFQMPVLPLNLADLFDLTTLFNNLTIPGIVQQSDTNAVVQSLASSSFMLYSVSGGYSDGSMTVPDLNDGMLVTFGYHAEAAANIGLSAAHQSNNFNDNTPDVLTGLSSSNSLDGGLTASANLQFDLKIGISDTGVYLFSVSGFLLHVDASGNINGSANVAGAPLTITGTALANLDIKLNLNNSVDKHSVLDLGTNLETKVLPLVSGNADMDLNLNYESIHLLFTVDFTASANVLTQATTISSVFALSGEMEVPTLVNADTGEAAKVLFNGSFDAIAGTWTLTGSLVGARLKGVDITTANFTLVISPTSFNGIGNLDIIADFIKDSAGNPVSVTSTVNFTQDQMTVSGTATFLTLGIKKNDGSTVANATDVVFSASVTVDFNTLGVTGAFGIEASSAEILPGSKLSASVTYGDDVDTKAIDFIYDFGTQSFSMTLDQSILEVENVLKMSAAGIVLAYDRKNTTGVQVMATVADMVVELTAFKDAATGSIPTVTISDFQIREDGFSLASATLPLDTIQFGTYLEIVNPTITMQNINYSTSGSSSGTITITSDASSIFPGRSFEVLLTDGTEDANTFATVTTLNVGTGALSSEIDQLDLKISDLVNVHSSNITFGYDPSISGTQTLVHLGSAQVTSPKFSGLGTVNITNMDLLSTGFTLESLRWDQAPSSTVSMGSMMVFEQVFLEVSNVSFNLSTGNFIGTITVGAARAELFPEKTTITALATDLSGSITLSSSAIPGLNISASSFEFAYGDMVSMSATGVSLTPDANMNLLFIASATADIPSLGISGSMTNFLARQDGIFGMEQLTINLQDSFVQGLASFIPVTVNEVSLTGWDWDTNGNGILDNGEYYDITKSELTLTGMIDFNKLSVLPFTPVFSIGADDFSDASNGYFSFGMRVVDGILRPWNLGPIVMGVEGLGIEGMFNLSGSIMLGGFVDGVWDNSFGGSFSFEAGSNMSAVTGSTSMTVTGSFDVDTGILQMNGSLGLGFKLYDYITVEGATISFSLETDTDVSPSFDMSLNSFAFNSASVDLLTVQLGTYMNFTSTEANLNFNAKGTEYFATFGMVQADLSSIGISGNVRNFALNANGAPIALDNFGVNFAIDATTASKVKWPNWLPIDITLFDVQWEDFENDPHKFQLHLSANVNVSKLSGSNLRLNGFIEEVVIDVGDLFDGKFPIKYVGGVGIEVGGEIAGCEVGGTLFFSIARVDADGNIIDDSDLITDVEERVLYAGIHGVINVIGMGGLEVRLGLSQYGPLQGFVKVNVPIPLGPTGVLLNSFFAGITFNSSLPDVSSAEELVSSPLIKSLDDITLIEWKEMLKVSAVEAMKNWDNLVSGNILDILLQPIRFEGGLSISAPGGTMTVQLQGRGILSTDGKLLVSGELTLGGSIAIEAGLFFDASNILEANAKVMAYLSIPAELKIVSVYGMLEIDVDGGSDGSVLLAMNGGLRIGIPGTEIVGINGYFQMFAQGREIDFVVGGSVSLALIGDAIGIEGKMTVQFYESDPVTGESPTPDVYGAMALQPANFELLESLGLVTQGVATLRFNTLDTDQAVSLTPPGQSSARDFTAYANSMGVQIEGMLLFKMSGEEWFRLDGLVGITIGADLLSITLDHKLVLGPGSDPWFEFSAQGYMMIRSTGIASKISIAPVPNPSLRDFDITMEANFTMMINTTGEDVSYTIPTDFPDYNGQRNIIIPRGPPSSPTVAESYMMIEATGTYRLGDIFVLTGELDMLVLPTQMTLNFDALTNLELLSVTLIDCSVVGNFKLDANGMLGVMEAVVSVGATLPNEIGTSQELAMYIDINTTNEAATVGDFSLEAGNYIRLRTVATFNFFGFVIQGSVEQLTTDGDLTTYTLEGTTYFEIAGERWFDFLISGSFAVDSLGIGGNLTMTVQNAYTETYGIGFEGEYFLAFNTTAYEVYGLQSNLGGRLRFLGKMTMGGLELSGSFDFEYKGDYVYLTMDYRLALTVMDEVLFEVTDHMELQMFVPYLLIDYELTPPDLGGLEDMGVKLEGSFRLQVNTSPLAHGDVPAGPIARIVASGLFRVGMMELSGNFYFQQQLFNVEISGSFTTALKLGDTTLLGFTGTAAFRAGLAGMAGSVELSVEGGFGNLENYGIKIGSEYSFRFVFNTGFSTVTIGDVVIEGRTLPYAEVTLDGSLFFGLVEITGRFGMSIDLLGNIKVFASGTTEMIVDGHVMMGFHVEGGIVLNIIGYAGYLELVEYSSMLSVIGIESGIENKYWLELNATGLPYTIDGRDLDAGIYVHFGVSGSFIMEDFVLKGDFQFTVTPLWVDISATGTLELGLNGTRLFLFDFNGYGTFNFLYYAIHLDLTLSTGLPEGMFPFEMYFDADFELTINWVPWDINVHGHTIEAGPLVRLKATGDLRVGAFRTYGIFYFEVSTQVITLQAGGSIDVIVGGATLYTYAFSGGFRLDWDGLSAALELTEGAKTPEFLGIEFGMGASYKVLINTTNKEKTIGVTTLDAGIYLKLNINGFLFLGVLDFKGVFDLTISTEEISVKAAGTMDLKIADAVLYTYGFAGGIRANSDGLVMAAELWEMAQLPEFLGLKFGAGGKYAVRFNTTGKEQTISYDADVPGGTTNAHTTTLEAGQYARLEITGFLHLGFETLDGYYLFNIEPDRISVEMIATYRYNLFTVNLMEYDVRGGMMLSTDGAAAAIRVTLRQGLPDSFNISFKTVDTLLINTTGRQQVLAGITIGADDVAVMRMEGEMILGGFSSTGLYELRMRQDSLTLTADATMYLKAGSTTLLSFEYATSFMISTTGVAAVFHLSSGTGLPSNLGFTISGTYTFQFNSTNTAQILAGFHLPANSVLLHLDGEFKVGGFLLKGTYIFSQTGISIRIDADATMDVFGVGMDVKGLFDFDLNGLTINVLLNFNNLDNGLIAIDGTYHFIANTRSYNWGGVNAKTIGVTITNGKATFGTYSVTGDLMIVADSSGFLLDIPQSNPVTLDLGGLFTVMVYGSITPNGFVDLTGIATVSMGDKSVIGFNGNLTVSISTKKEYVYHPAQGEKYLYYQNGELLDNPDKIIYKKREGNGWFSWYIPVSVRQAVSMRHPDRILEMILERGNYTRKLNPDYVPAYTEVRDTPQGYDISADLSARISVLGEEVASLDESIDLKIRAIDREYSVKAILTDGLYAKGTMRIQIDGNGIYATIHNAEVALFGRKGRVNASFDTRNGLEWSASGSVYFHDGGDLGAEMTIGISLGSRGSSFHVSGKAWVRIGSYWTGYATVSTSFSTTVSATSDRISFRVSKWGIGKTIHISLKNGFRVYLSNISGGTAFLDVNYNGVMDEGEVSTTVNENGYFNFYGNQEDYLDELPSHLGILAPFDTNGNGTIDYEEGVIVVRGGKDADSGVDNPITVKVSASSAGSAIQHSASTFSTLHVGLMEQGMSHQDAEAAIHNALGLEDGSDIHTYDPRLESSHGDATRANLLAESAKIQTLLTHGEALMGAGTNAQDAVTKHLVTMIASMDPSTPDAKLDLSKQETVHNILINAAKTTGSAVDEKHIAAVARLSSDMMQVIESLKSSSAEDLDKALASVKGANIQSISGHISDLTSGVKSVNEFYGHTSGNNLHQSISSVGSSSSIASIIASVGDKLSITAFTQRMRLVNILYVSVFTRSDTAVNYIHFSLNLAGDDFDGLSELSESLMEVLNLNKAYSLSFNFLATDSPAQGVSESIIQSGLFESTSVTISSEAPTVQIETL